ncbi:MAG TPA: DUF349 domain-containing protein [Bacteroidales bacterium]|nr:DUF349 domain-containing protein [Bacteroidales bacterium]
MTSKNPDDSVRDEQFGAEKKAAGTENANKAENAEENSELNDAVENSEENDEVVDADAVKEEDIASESDSDNNPEDEPPGTTESGGESDDNEASENIESGDAGDAEKIPGEPDKEQAEKEDVTFGAEDGKEMKEEPVADVDKTKETDKEEDKGATDTSGDEEPDKDTEDEDADQEAAELPPVDYSGYSKHELIETLGLLIDNRPPAEIKNDVDRLKVLFYRKLKVEADERRAKFLQEGGKIEDYRVWVDPDEARVKDLLDRYREKKTDFTRVQEAEKYENLKKKYEIIDKIKDLVNREESINKTFHDFRALQNDWHSVGVVPQSSLKDLWENYHHSVEIFYDYIKINKELRDLDLKKNLESKVSLCEKAEELLLEPNPVNAFRALQDYHNQWREIGPVPAESKNEIWERFKEATSKINKRHHEYFEKQKDDQKKNLDAKIALCEEVEAINELALTNFKDFDENAEKVIKLQKIWRTIGFAPKKQNNKVYQRFREACDAFFEKKRGFYADNKEIQLNNLQLKTELCIQAEALQESTDWKSTSDALIRLQKEWKEIGPVPRKQSEKCWKRFRRACDTFFNRKAEFFAQLDNSYEDNLKAKVAIIEELEKFEPGSDVQAAFDKLKEIQKRWTDIGFVPFNMKDEINNRYRNALNKEFDKLKIGDEDKSILKYKTKLDNLKTNPKASRKVRNEREKFFTKIKQLENDIVLWENNIGFFAKSSNAETMIKEVEEKIENAKKLIKTLEEKVKMIDQSGLDE